MKNSSSNMASPQVIVAVALDCEARPLIDYYKLKRDHDVTAFKIYSCCNSEIILVVTGVGKVNSAAAMGFIFHYAGAGSHFTFINVGIAGGDRAMGDCYLIDKISDHATGNCFFLHMVSDLACLPTINLISYDQPQQLYSDQYLMDMEASGWVQTLLHMVNIEQIQLIKIVSDNGSQSIARINASHVVRLISEQLTAIDQVVNYSRQLSRTEASHHCVSPYYALLCQKYHFSHYQANQLKELLSTWSINFPKLDPVKLCAQAVNAKDVLKLLTSKLAILELL